MTEPTIDELIAQTDDYYRDPEQYMSRVYLEAIRAILEHHEKLCATAERIKLDAIRAFVERVEKRINEPRDWRDNTRSNAAYIAMQEELAALEGEANAGTID